MVKLLADVPRCTNSIASAFNADVARPIGAAWSARYPVTVEVMGSNPI